MDSMYEIDPLNATWTRLIEDYEPSFGKIYEDLLTRERYTFEGILWSHDDYYYCMYGSKSNDFRLISCVMNLDDAGLFQIDQ